jgi:hypothetical protein
MRTEDSIVVDPDVLLADATAKWGAWSDELESVSAAANMPLGVNEFSNIGDSENIRRAYSELMNQLVDYTNQGSTVFNNIARTMLTSARDYLTEDGQAQTLIAKRIEEALADL